MLYVYFRIGKADVNFHEYLKYLGVSVVFGFCGARVLFVIAILPQIQITADNLIYYILNGGIVFYGGMLGMIFGIGIMSRIIHKDFGVVINIVAPAIPLFHFFARIGCLFAGCCYGIPYSWGVIMLDSPDIIRFPVQLLESLCNLVIFFILVIKERKTKSKCGNINIYLILYAICRFFIEFYRGDEVRGIWFLGLSTAQIVSLTILFLNMMGMVKKKCVVKTLEEDENI